MPDFPIDENKVLRDALSGLNEEIPPMPQGVHAAWVQQVEADAEKTREETRIEKTRTRQRFTRFLSIAAAMVFVLGGTLLTRGRLDDAPAGGAVHQTAAAPMAYKARGAGGEAVYTDEAAAEEAAYDAGAANGVMTFTTAEATGKKIIRNASLTIQTQTYDESLQALRTLTEDAAGWIESFSESEGSNGLRRAYLTLRIPQAQLDAVLSGLDGTGRVTSRSESAADVTASYQDTAARLATQKALMERLQALITESADLSDLLALESQIADTQYMIDTLQSALNDTDRQVDYATVHVSLYEENAPAITDDTASLGDRLAGALRTGVSALAAFAADVLLFLTAAAPFLLILAAAVGVAVLIRRIRRRK